MDRRVLPRGASVSYPYPSAGVARFRDSFASFALRHRLILDLVERAFVVALYANFAWRFFHQAAKASNVLLLLMIVSETLPVFLMLVRRHTNMSSLSMLDWILAFAGTAAPLLVSPAALSPIVPFAFCLVLAVLGIELQVAAKLTLARGFGIVAANRGVRDRGPYRFVRHPMYAGYTLTNIGFLLACPSRTNLIVYAFALAFQVCRIIREERFLTADLQYRQYSDRVRYRLLPGLF